MSEVTYEIVEHDGGWAYKSQGVFSEPYPTHAAALKAARIAAAEQQVPGPAAPSSSSRTRRASGTPKPTAATIGRRHRSRTLSLEGVDRGISSLALRYSSYMLCSGCGMGAKRGLSPWRG